MKYIFFGTPSEATIVLDALSSAGHLPSLVITAPDRPAGRGLMIKESSTAIWAKSKNIEVYKPESLKNNGVKSYIEKFSPEIAIVFAYGKIIPQSILDFPTFGTLNIHPSLLPFYRGPSPVESAILAGDKETGVSIMRLDSEMDHGPILIQSKFPATDDSGQIISSDLLLKKLIEIGSERLVEILPDYLAGKIESIPQDHSIATYTKKISKADGEINPSDDPAELYRKYCAFSNWPGIFYFEENNGKKIRINIKKARLENNKFIIERIVPEGKNEVDYKN